MNKETKKKLKEIFEDELGSEYLHKLNKLITTPVKLNVESKYKATKISIDCFGDRNPFNIALLIKMLNDNKYQFGITEDVELAVEIMYEKYFHQQKYIVKESKDD